MGVGACLNISFFYSHPLWTYQRFFAITFTIHFYKILVEMWACWGQKEQGYCQSLLSIERISGDFSGSLVLRTQHSQCKGPTEVPGQGTRSHMLPLKILCATTKTWYKINTYLIRKKERERNVKWLYFQLWAELGKQDTHIWSVNEDEKKD